MEKHKLWEVTAEARDRQTGKPVGPRRSEIISTENKVFALCGSAAQVIHAYEAFWNTSGSVERVKVISVWPATQAQDDAPRPNPLPEKVAQPVVSEIPKASPGKVKPSAQRRLAKRAEKRIAAAEAWAKGPVANAELAMQA